MVRISLTVGRRGWGGGGEVGLSVTAGVCENHLRNIERLDKISVFI